MHLEGCTSTRTNLVSLRLNTRRFATGAEDERVGYVRVGSLAVYGEFAYETGHMLTCKSHYRLCVPPTFF